MTTAQSIQKTGEFSTHYALTCFAIGTLLLLIHFKFPDNIDILILGLCFVIVAIITNGIVLVHLMYHFITDPFRREYYAIKILILLSNIPVTYCYLLLIFNKN